MAFNLRDYDILETIGQGGMGSVLKARQKSLGRLVAIKCLTPQREQNESEILHFRREAETMALLTHDNILTIFDYAFAGDQYYIVMEYIDGMTFDDALNKGVGRDESLVVLDKVLAGLHHAHSRKIIHRDIKPGNMLIGRQGQVKLADFGLAFVHQDLTRTSSAEAVMGTYCYMAPEAMVSPRDVDERIDVFSIGCILYRVLAGRPPFSGATLGEISYQVLHTQPASLDSDGAPKQLADITVQCLAKERDGRPRVEIVRNAIRAALGDRYHAGHERLIAFVDGTRGRSVSPGGTAGSRAARARPASRPVRRRRGYAVAGVAIVLVALALSIAAGLRQHRKSGIQKRLPMLPALETMRNTRERAGPPEASPGIPLESPQPLTSETPELATSRLVLDKVRPEDSVWINGGIVTGQRSARGMEIMLEPGHYKIELRSASGARIAREVDVLPYQKLLIKMDSERGRNAR